MFLFQELPYGESDMICHVIIFRDTDCLGLQTKPPEVHVIKI